jgi:hypothetical protein
LGGTGGTVLVGGEVTGGVDMGAGSAVSANRIPTQSGVYNYVRNSTVTSFNGATGAVTGASLGANTFTALNTFNAGISAAGGVTLAGTLQGTTAAFTGLVSSTVGFSGSGTNLKIIVTTFNGLSGAVTGASLGANTFTALNTFNAGISASTLTVSGGVTFSGNVSLGDFPTGVTADSNDFVRILNVGAYNYRSGIYRSYKTLAGATSGVVCVTPADTGNNVVNTFEVTLEYWQSGYTTTTAVHKFWIVVTYDNTGAVSAFDYTESIVKGSFAVLVPFTISIPSPYTSVAITAAAPANTGKFSGWVFISTVRVY